ncbi:hypothetical protein WJX72_009147 [[Myrmecia] bisecta]|uniref:F-box domain-containing protein n=1 Tax=[Myrmecia] bisecta TaxID=41462 RepID=A0AAW1PWY7_9CHLO
MAVLLTHGSDTPEILPSGVSLEQIFRGPVYSARLVAGGYIHWSTSSDMGSEVHGNRPDNHAPGHQSTVSGCGEVYEPRSRLMWSIVGKATSTQFEQPSRTVDEACLSTVQLPGIPSPSASAYRSSAACPAAGHISPAPLSTLPADAVVQCKQSFPDAAGDPDSAVSHHSLGPWGDLPPELVVKMALPLAGNAGQVIAMSGVCRAWRRVLAADGPFLQAIHFKIKQSHASQSLRGLHLTQPPWLAQKAAAAGNDGLAAGKPLSPARLLSSAALLLGYLHFDGEAAKQDVAEAVRWFKVAAASGSREAENMLGTLFNTGQYG